MKRLSAIILIFAICSALTGHAQETTEQTQIETLFGSLKPGELDIAVNTFAKDSLMPSVEVDRLKSAVRRLLPTERTILGFEFIQEQNFGASVKRLVYVLKTNDQPLVWYFTYYKPEETWALLRVFVGDETLLY